MENTTALAQDAGPAQPDSPFQSLAELRDAHLGLKRFVSDLDFPSERQAAGTQQIRAFLVRARKTGAFLRTPKERRPAQVILDYWCAELGARPDATGSDFDSLMLDQFERDPTVPASEAPPPSKEEQREFIRLSALARQWQESQQQEGYLLEGDAIQRAKAFAGRDPNLGKFVAASEEAVRRAEEAARRARERRLYILIGAMSLAFLFPIALVVAGGLILWLQTDIIPARANKLIHEMGIVADGPRTPERHPKTEAEQRKAQVDGFWWLSFYQRISPASYDLTTVPKFADLRLPYLTLNAPNFVGREFSNVKFTPGAVLAGALFSGSTIHENTEFIGADLTAGQFREARIQSTSFVGANLYRAVFDLAVLCDDDFSEAAVRGATFWSASINARTYQTLRNTAWWLASGWGSQDLHRLLDNDTPPAKPLIETIAFRAELQRARTGLSHTAAGTVQRALALHDLAWSLAIWGVTSGVPPSDSCPTDNNDPRNALDAVERAICIVADKQQYADHYASFQDTKAYILMQNGKMAEAAAIYQSDEMKSQLAEEREVFFRFALARYAIATDDAAKQLAMDWLKSTIGDKTTAIADSKYLPTHELKLLYRYIPQELWPTLRDVIDVRWPSTLPRRCS